MIRLTRLAIWLPVLLKRGLLLGCRGSLGKHDQVKDFEALSTLNEMPLQVVRDAALEVFIDKLDEALGAQVAEAVHNSLLSASLEIDEKRAPAPPSFLPGLFVNKSKTGSYAPQN